MASLFSNLAANAALWFRHEPDYATQLAVVHAAAGSDRTVTSNALVSSNAHSPTVLAFQLYAEPTKIYIGHSPIRYPTAVTPFDDLVMVLRLVGDDLEDASPVVLPADAFSRLNLHAFYNNVCQLKAVASQFAMCCRTAAMASMWISTLLCALTPENLNAQPSLSIDQFVLPCASCDGIS